MSVRWPRRVRTWDQEPMAAPALGLAAVFCPLVAATANAADWTEKALLYRNLCASSMPPPAWDEEEDGPWVAPGDWEPDRLCPLELTPDRYATKCALPTAPEGWDEDEDGAYEPEPGSEPMSCVFLFVPHLLDDGVPMRLHRLGTHLAAARALDLPLHHFWLEAGAQPDLEQAFSISTFPIVTVHNANKNAGLVMTHALTEDNMASFFRRAAIGRVPDVRTFAMPSVRAVQQWNGSEPLLQTCADDHAAYDDVELEVDI